MGDYLYEMEKDWITRTLKMRGKTTADVAAAIGRDRAVVSRIINGHQVPTIDQARIFSELLNVDLPEVLLQFGLADKPTAQAFAPGFSESDAVPFELGPGLGIGHSVASISEVFGGGRPGIDVWRVKSAAMSLGGILPGDFMLVDTHQADRVRSGDVVIAQVYQRNGTAMTVLRRFEPPVLVAASADPGDARVHVVDGSNVVVRGKITAVWRA